MDEGRLISSDLVVTSLQEEISKIDAENFIISGFPKNIENI